MNLPKHNHVTRDIKEKGKCPACDAIYHHDFNKENLSFTERRENTKNFKKIFEIGHSPIDGTICYHIYTDNPHEASDFFKISHRDNRNLPEESISLSVFTPQEDIDYDTAVTHLKRNMAPGKLIATRFLTQTSETSWAYCYLGIYLPHGA